MPFAGYEDFDACVAANQDAEDPDAYCAALMRAVEGRADAGLTVLAQKGAALAVVADDGGVHLLDLAAGTLTALEADELLTLLEFDTGWETVDEPAAWQLRTPGPVLTSKRLLGRRPKKFEAKLLSLREIPRTLDLAVSDVVAALPTAERDARLLVTMQEVATFGAREVFRELVRQGAPSALLDERLPVDVTALCAQIAGDCDLELAAAQAEVDTRLRRKRLSEVRRAEILGELVECRTPGILKRSANRAVHEAFAFGRAQAMQALRKNRPGALSLAADVSVEAVVQTAVFDTNMCEACEAVNGEVMEYGSARQEELHPPYVKCLGGDRCRCIQIALLSDGREIDVDEIDEDDLETF
jgi:hypothetical protein